MYCFLDSVNNCEAYVRLLHATLDKKFVGAFGVQPNEKPVIASASPSFVLYVCSDYVEARRVYRAVSALTCGKVVYVPAAEDVLLYKSGYSKTGVYERNRALFDVLHGAACAVTCVESLLQPFPDCSAFLQGCFRIKQGGTYDTTKLAAKLVACGYSRVDGITGEGEFTLRGDILDLSMPGDKRFRVDFWDDTVESVKSVGSDGTAATADYVDVYPLWDVGAFSEAQLVKLSALVGKMRISVDAKARLSEIVSDLTAQAGGKSVDNRWLAPFVKTSRLFDYLPCESVVMWDEPKLLSSRVEFLYNEHSVRVANLSKAGEVLPVHMSAYCEKHDVFSCDLPQISLQTLPYQSDFFVPDQIFNFKTGAVPNYANSEDALATDIRNWKRSGYEVAVLCGEDGVKPVQDAMSARGVYLAEVEKLNLKTSDGLVLPLALERGFVSHTNKLVVLGARDIGRGVVSQAVRKSKKQAFLSVEKGDYVVHDVHGIGLCEGIQKITSPDGETKDYVVVLYKGGDKLYVPVDATNMLSRYSGGENPTLSKIGGADFAKVKNKVAASIREMSVDLLKLYSEREKPRGFRYHVDEYLCEEFEQYFPYKPTEDQLKCMEEITKDLTSDRIMDRLLVGDVGYGKTEVAMRAAFEVVSNGYQVAVLAPTTILAEQHFNTFRERMEHFDVKVVCLNRFRTPEQQKQILKEVADGKADVIVGTHRLLSSDVKFNKLGLLILDEEQRFGVEHKEKIKAVKTSVDVLTLSATPIPRTLHMALSGMRDISTITTPPVERIAVETFVCEESETLIADVISRELARGGQVYCVYNRVSTIDSFASRLADMVPQANITVAHGQMGESRLEDAVLDFAQGKGNVLVCTTIIENGIDIPNANTLIVTDADKLGLSQLYQLRGRVGRSNRIAYAYFLYRKDKILSEIAYKRLSSITEYSELGSGFKIAMKDLEIRGAGNVLGREQHGHMVKVGYDMYARLLSETVAELKGKKVQKEIVPELEIDYEAYAPDGYIPSQTERMDFYQQLASCKTLAEVDEFHSRIEDVYGTCPVQVNNLFRIARLKVACTSAGVSKVVVRSGRGEVLFANRDFMMRKEVFDALSTCGSSVTAMSGTYGVQFSSSDFVIKERLLSAIEDFLAKIQANYSKN